MSEGDSRRSAKLSKQQEIDDDEDFPAPSVVTVVTNHGGGESAQSL